MTQEHTPTPWEIYEQPIADADAAKEELSYQVDHTEPLGPTLYLLNAGGKCPALTGCGPASKANAELIVTAVNSYASSQAEIARLRDVLDEIGGFSRFLRQGGPDPMDLEGLSDGLSQAIDMAHAALSEGK